MITILAAKGHGEGRNKHISAVMALLHILDSLRAPHETMVVRHVLRKVWIAHALMVMHAGFLKHRL